MADNAFKSFAFVITKTASAYRSLLAKNFALKGYGEITPDYWIVLEQLWIEDNLSLGLLANKTHKDPASISRIIEGMAKKGLVKKVKNANDSRFSNVVLTKKGAELQAKIQPIVDEFFTEATRGLNPIEVKELVRMLEHVFSNTNRE